MSDGQRYQIHQTFDEYRRQFTKDPLDETTKEKIDELEETFCSDSASESALAAEDESP